MPLIFLLHILWTDAFKTNAKENFSNDREMCCDAIGDIPGDGVYKNVVTPIPLLRMDSCRPQRAGCEHIYFYHTS